MLELCIEKEKVWSENCNEINEIVLLRLSYRRTTSLSDREERERGSKTSSNWMRC